MPELPEVETVRRGLEPALVGKRLERVETRRKDLRFPLPQDMAVRLTGRSVTALGRRAKYLLIHLSEEPAGGAETLLCHLGMSGSFRVEEGVTGAFHHPRSVAPRHDHVVLETADGTRVTYNDPRRFGFMDLVPTARLDENPHLCALGPEPVGNTPLAPHLARLFGGKRAPLKAALLDQKGIAGLGNIYVCEALHRAGLSPRRGAGTLVGANGRATARLERLEEAIRAVIADAIAAGGSSLRDHRQTDGALGYFQHAFRAYDREGQACPTPGCGGTITRIVQSGRSTFYCPACQR
ncbi:MAG: bifunctional DNA-formamidopyrimidine glycosylase/DNA-(apurinic or apyrimidinic site) lyase [Hyphomicrobiaceae bacterium]|nr:bifunctional DNA-formamidopyrimidine glycosylase/DNA-(apurinic or apyrimidinic site) lyase [Hyphomicrobiaceae bacterium]